jgi:hypothetical protein
VIRDSYWLPELVRWIVSHNIRTDALLTHVEELEQFQQTTRRHAVI